MWKYIMFALVAAPMAMTATQARAEAADHLPAYERTAIGQPVMTVSAGAGAELGPDWR